MAKSNAEHQRAYRARQKAAMAAALAGVAPPPAKVFTITGLSAAEHRVLVQALKAYRAGAA